MPCVGVCVGDLRHRIEFFDKAAGTSDGMGGESTPTPVSIATLWAAVKPKIKTEVFENEDIRGIVTHSVFIRFTTAVSDFMERTFTFRGRSFEIIGYRDIDEAQVLIELLATEMTAG